MQRKLLLCDKLSNITQWKELSVLMKHLINSPTLPYPTLPYPTLPYPTLPYPTLPYPTLPYPTLPYPTLPYPTIPYHTLPYPTLPIWETKTGVRLIILRKSLPTLA